MSVRSMSRVREEDAVSTVGHALESMQVYSLSHPAYRLFAEAVDGELNEIADREAGRRSAAKPLLCTGALSPDEMACLARHYPEYAVKVIPLNKPVHTYYKASRKCANEWLDDTNANYAKKTLHFGGSLTGALGSSRRGVHIELDTTNEVMVHDNHAEVVDLHRLFGDFARAQSEYGVVLPRGEYTDYVAGRAYRQCTSPATCTHQVDALAVDLSIQVVTPEQVALAMLQHGAKLCHGFFPYCPEMLVQNEGNLGNTGVAFVRTEKEFVFSYPEGVSGVTKFPTDVWASWIASHCFPCGFGPHKEWFQVELLKNRDGFMFFRMVSVPKPDGMEVVHALDLPQNEDLTMVMSWRLKGGLSSDLSKEDQWEPNNFLIHSRIERRVREYAMQLPPDQFSRFALKKQIRIVNNRWVINGSTVAVAPSLSPGQVEDLTTAIFSRVFVDRYASSRLASEMMTALREYAAFNSMNTMERIKTITLSVVSSMYRSSVGRFGSSAREWLDWIRDLSGGKTTIGKMAKAIPAPTYVGFSVHIGLWRRAFSNSGERFYTMAREVDKKSVAEGGIAGSLASLTASPWRKTGVSNLVDVVRICTSVSDVRLGEEVAGASELVSQVGALNEMDSVTESRYNLEFETAIRESTATVGHFVEAGDPDPVSSLNSLYSSAFPGVARQPMEADTFSLSLDPQDRVLAAPYMKMPSWFGPPPSVRSYYRSKLNALNVPKRQNTGPELLTAVAARNLAVPVISQPQDELIIADIWETFLTSACVPDAKAKLRQYQADPVSLAADSLKDWAAKARPEVVSRVRADLERSSRALAEMPISEYLVMLKADVKPTLSNKPLSEVTAPQVIVYHDKPLSALYSSVFRVLVQRFMSLIKPNYHINLLKDSADIARFLTACHPYEEGSLRYLENDFSKYDKSQSQFAFDLEYYVFQQLGMNADMLENWLDGHTDCSLRALSTGLSLHVMYQRKSGDATTAFGNVILNVLSVTYAYKGTEVVWAVFMGDDSIVCAKQVNGQSEAVQMLAEVFNLTAKYYITDAPYFASNFIVVDKENTEVKLYPDPIKRIERLSMHISADDPQWKERHVSFQDSMSPYLESRAALALATRVPQRYEVPEGYVGAAAKALGTLAQDFGKFRALWHELPEVVDG